MKDMNLEEITYVEIKDTYLSIKLKLEKVDTNNFEVVKEELLGKKGKITELLRKIGTIDKNDRAEYGKQVNLLKSYIEQEFEKFTSVQADDLVEQIDVTAPFDINIPENKKPKISNKSGHINPLMKELDYILDIFKSMGFEVMASRQLDDDFHHFETLNFPKGHPARDMWDTFWTDEGLLTIAHTSTMQNRALKSHQPPIRYVIPGMCYRNEATDPRHEHTLYQVEGVYVDKGVTFGDMVGTIKTYLEGFFKTSLEIKILTGYFPFTEPSIEFAVSCPYCNKTGCVICGQSGWIELMGCGMIHPNVLKAANIDPTVYSGFAWGFGLDRMVMIKNGIKDVRRFRSGDMKFLSQF